MADLSALDFEELLELIAQQIEVYYFCDTCGEFREEPIVVRECSNDACGEIFNGTEEGRNCPSCNRPFTRKLTSNGCEICVDDGELEKITLDELINERDNRACIVNEDVADVADVEDVSNVEPPTVDNELI